MKIKFFLFICWSETNPSTFEAVFVVIKNELYLDLSGVMSDTLGDEDYRNSFLTVANQIFVTCQENVSKITIRKGM